MTTQTPAPMAQLLQQSRTASYTMATLGQTQKNQALECFAQRIEHHLDWLLSQNQKDLEAQSGVIAPSLYQRLKLDRAKLLQLVQGLRDVVNLPDPTGQVLQKTLLDDGLVLEKKSVPLGVIGIIFESRPDVIPQILSLILKSGNAVVLKGGSEATHSNRAFMTLVDEVNAQCPCLPVGWATLIEGREAVHELLNFPQYVDLVIPRGSNQLVQSIMAATRIPVLGHADGVCHMYVSAHADLNTALSVVLDAKCQYPAACNALETLLVDQSVAPQFLPQLAQAALAQGLTLKTRPDLLSHLPGAQPVEDWHTEYGDLTLAVNVVEGLDEAIHHINTYGSGHTDCILSTDPAQIDTFMARVDSANVFANASTRFADGFRFGLGAEIGISTAKTHARGPVGLEGLVIYKYQLHGQGQIVATYAGPTPRPFKHTKL